MRPRVLVADTWSKDVDNRLKRAFPNARFIPLGTPSGNHPHGHMVTEALLTRFGQGEIDIYLYAHLEEQQQHTQGWLEQARKHQIPWINNSWGATARGSYVVPQHRDMEGLLALFAAGNSDRSRRGKPDTTWDVNEPQRSLAHLQGTVIIGSCDARGLPSTWSSDGLVDVAYRGERHWLFNPLTGFYEWVDGTSFACPLASADAVRMNLRTEEQLKEWWSQPGVATRAPGWPANILHPKTGRGFISDALPKAPHVASLSYSEYTRVS